MKNGALLSAVQAKNKGTNNLELPTTPKKELRRRASHTSKGLSEGEEQDQISDNLNIVKNEAFERAL
jgi:hypothetical protein